MFVQVSNISDAGYLGIYHTLVILPLLQGPLTNPHTTLITLFMNVVDENLTDEDGTLDTSTGTRLLQYHPLMEPLTMMSEADTIKMSFAYGIVATYDHVFDR
jgi:hypothetical protein